MKQFLVIISILLFTLSSANGAIITGHYVIDSGASNHWAVDHTVTPAEGLYYLEALNGGTRVIIDCSSADKTLDMPVGAPVLMDPGTSLYYQDYHSQYESVTTAIDTGDGPYTDGTGTFDYYFTVSFINSGGSITYTGIIGDIIASGFGNVTDGTNIYDVVVNYIATEDDFDNGTDGSLDYNAGIIREGTVDISSVPIPAAIWLLGFGLVGLVGIKRKLK